MSENIMYKNIADKMKQANEDSIEEILDKLSNRKEETLIAGLRECQLKNIEHPFITKEEYINEVLDYITNLQQENERLKELNENASKVCMAEHRYGVDKAEEARDYKSRCEKAIEYIKKDTRWFDSEYAKVYGELCSCAGANANRLEILVNPSNLLNILNGRSDE